MPKNAFGDEIAAPSSGGTNSFGDPIQGAASATPIASLPTIKPRALGTINSDMSSLQTHGFSPLSMEDETANSPLAEGHQREAREQYRAPVESDPNLSPVQNVIKNVVAKPLAQMGANSEKAGFGQSAFNTLKGFGHSLTSLPEPLPGPNAGADGLQDSPMTGLVTPARQIAAGNYGGAAGTLTTPLAMMAATHGVSKGLQNMAPGLFERGMGVRNPDRAFERTPGRTGIDETYGVHPETVSKSAQENVSRLTPEHDTLINNSPAQIDINPTRQIPLDKQSQLGTQNATGAAQKLQPIVDFLHQADPRFKGTTAGGQIAGVQPASAVLALKRGVNNEFIDGKWNPDNAQAHGTAKKVYNSLDQSLDNAVPGSQELNQRISSQIPLIKRGAAVARNEDLAARITSRVAARTGGMLGAAAGAAEGHRLGGGPGAVIGGLTGLAVPELITSPTAQIGTARAIDSIGNLGEKLAPLIPFLTLKQKEEESEAEKKRVGP